MRHIKETKLADFPFWSGGADRAKMLTRKELNQVGDELECLFSGEGRIPSATDINDLFWFDFAWICELIGYTYDEEKDIIIR